MDFVTKLAGELWILSDRVCYAQLMRVARRLNLPELLEQKSFFLFGPRAVGKSTLIEQQLTGQATVIDLLDTATYKRITSDYRELEAVVTNSEHSIFVIDEIQKLPQLLNDVHRLIERQRVHFLLTGSSTRKLRREGVNLLAGRAWQAQLLPLTKGEIPQFKLDHYLHYGGMPAVNFSKRPEEELRAYVSTYMQHEIQQEGLVRKLPAFTRFLQTMALSNCEVLNYTKIGNDCQVAPSTVTEYVQILEDTLLGSLLLPCTATRQRKAIRTAKFYFFDTGVARTLADIEHIERNSSLYGKSFEHFIYMELQAYLAYTRQRHQLMFWRTRHGYEVDFVVGKELAVEVKAAKAVSRRDLKGLRAFAQEGICKKFYLVSQDRLDKKYDNFYAVHWETFLQLLWNNKLLTP